MIPEQIEGNYYSLRSGQGREILQDGGYYEGRFYMGKRHGNGTMTLANGTVTSGRWEKGVLKLD